MSTKAAKRQSSTDYDHDHDRALDPARYRRAGTEAMAVERAADRLYSVANGDGDGEAYTVDLATSACECPDARWRSETACKHAIRASFVDVYRGRKTRSALAARVIAFAIANPCPRRDARVQRAVPRARRRAVALPGLL